MPRFSLSALGSDGPGIVAAVSGALGEQGCNLEDSTMTILQGQFAILLVVTAPEGTGAAALEAALGPTAERFDLVVAVRPLKDAAPVESSSVEDSDVAHRLASRCGPARHRPRRSGRARRPRRERRRPLHAAGGRPGPAGLRAHAPGRRARGVCRRRRGRRHADSFGVGGSLHGAAR